MTEISPITKSSQRKKLAKMKNLFNNRRAQILRFFIEGVSVRAKSRLTGAAKNTIAKLLEEAGEAFAASERAFPKSPLQGESTG